MTATATDPPARRGRRERMAVIDCDVHNVPRSRDEVRRYLPAKYHVFYDQGSHLGGHHGAQVLGARPQIDIFRGDSWPASGPPGSDLDLMREQLLEPLNIEKAVLISLEMLTWNPYGEYGAACCRALNDWNVDLWLERDKRLYGAIAVTVEDGVRAAVEIERCAQHPRFVKVMLPMATREGLGHPKYWPIYEAAAAHGLPIAAHVGGFSGTHLATGWPAYFVEHHTGYTQPYHAQVASLVYSGVFDSFPSLRFVLEEGGLAWLPSLMWRLDRAWEEMREYVPHLTRLPSEIIRDHFAFTTQPMDEPEHPRYLLQLLEQLDMTDRIMYSSDYPHWDYDDPNRILPSSLITGDVRRKILHDNAAGFYSWPAEA